MIEFIFQISAVAAAGVLSVMALALFFKWLPKLGPNQEGVKIVSSGRFMEDGEIYDITLNSGQKVKRVCFVGFIRLSGDNGDFPWQIQGIGVFKNDLVFRV